MMVMTLMCGSTASTYFGTNSGPRILPTGSLIHGGFNMELDLYTIALPVLATACGVLVVSTYLGINSEPRILPTYSFTHGGFNMELNLYTLALPVLATARGDFVPGNVHMDLTCHVSDPFYVVPSLQVGMKS